MAKTIEEAFDLFHTWLTPTKTESDRAKSHRASIEGCLKSNLGMKRFFRIGSFGNGTSISSYSDVDYIASIPREKLKDDSNETLKEIKKILDNRFPNTGVYIDAPAVVVPFGDDPSEITEIVPADFIDRKNDCSTYEIPNSDGGWMRANPELHNAYVNSINNKSGLNKMVKPLIRFIKAWKYYNDVPISSFYLEMFVTLYASKESCIVYSIDINKIFLKLRSTGLVSITDPKNISGQISACSNMTNRNETLSKLDEAIRYSTNAVSVEIHDKVKAFNYWGKVFDDFFPSYY